MKQNLRRLEEDRDADHQALRTAVLMSGHLVPNAGAASASSHTGGEGKGDKGAFDHDTAKGKGKAKGKKK